MTTPPPDTKVETLEQIAERIAKKHVVGGFMLKTALRSCAADVLSALRNERETFVRLVTEKRDGATARYAHGGYSRELWHLNTETLKTVCNELLKEIE